MDYLGKDMRRLRGDDKEKKEDHIVALDEADIELLRTYGSGPYNRRIKLVEDKIQSTLKRVNELTGIKVFTKLKFH